MADRVGRLEMGFRLALPNKVAIRRPDHGVVRHDNPVALAGPVQSYRGIFDLCIEGVSTSIQSHAGTGHGGEERWNTRRVESANTICCIIRPDCGSSTG